MRVYKVCKTHLGTYSLWTFIEYIRVDWGDDGGWWRQINVMNGVSLAFAMRHRHRTNDQEVVGRLPILLSLRSLSNPIPSRCYCWSCEFWNVTMTVEMGYGFAGGRGWFVVVNKIGSKNNICNMLSELLILCLRELLILSWGTVINISFPHTQINRTQSLNNRSFRDK